MHKYRVVKCNGEDRLLLEGGVGRYHRVRVLNEPPRVGELLSGSRPHLGFGLLQGSQSTHVFRVIFETINGIAPGFDTGWIGEPLSTSWQGAARADP